MFLLSYVGGTLLYATKIGMVKCIKSVNEICDVSPSELHWVFKVVINFKGIVYRTKFSRLY